MSASLQDQLPWSVELAERSLQDNHLHECHAAQNRLTDSGGQYEVNWKQHNPIMFSSCLANLISVNKDTPIV